MAEEVARLVAVMEAQLRGFTKGMEQAQKIADQRFGAIEKRMRQTESAFGKFGTGIGSSFTRFLGTAAVIAFSKSVLDMASSLGEQAQQIGVSVEGLQAYRAALATANISQSETDTLLTRLTRNMGEAAGGSKNLRAAFAAVGISAKELSGGPEAVLPKIATELLKIPDAGTRARLEFDLFGRSGQKLESALRILATPTTDLIEKGKALGVVLGRDVADAADKAKDRLDQAFIRLKTSAAPAVAAVAEQIANLIDQLERLAKTNPQVLAALVGAAAGGRIAGLAGAAAGAAVGGLAGGGAFSDIAKGGNDILTRETVAGGNSARLRSLAQAAGIPLALSNVKVSTDAAVNAAIAVADDLDAAEKMLRDGQARLLSSFKLRDPVEFELPATSNTLSNKDRVSEAINDAEEARQENQRRIDSADTRLAEEAGARQIELADQLRGAFDITGAAGMMAFDNIGDAAQQALQQIAAMVFQLGVMEPILNGLFGKKGEGGGLFGAAFSAIFGSAASVPTRHSGGPVTAGMPYRVLKNEVFVPNVSGRVLPKNASMGGSTNLNWTINVKGTTDKELIAQMRAGAAQMLWEYDRNLPRRVQGIASDPYFVR